MWFWLCEQRSLTIHHLRPFFAQNLKTLFLSQEVVLNSSIILKNKTGAKSEIDLYGKTLCVKKPNRYTYTLITEGAEEPLIYIWNETRTSNQAGIFENVQAKKTHEIK